MGDRVIWTLRLCRINPLHLSGHAVRGAIIHPRQTTLQPEELES